MLRANRLLSPRRRGAALVQLAVTATLMMGFAALAVDTGSLYVARVELQRAADAAALGGASGIVTEAGLAQDVPTLTGISLDRTGEVAVLNNTGGAPTIVSAADFAIGTFDFNDPAAGLDPSGSLRRNAVQITARKTPSSLNGGVTLYFASIFGMSEGSVTATAIAAFDDRFSEYDVSVGGAAPLLPFTKLVSEYDALAVAGQQVLLYPAGPAGPGNGQTMPGNFGELRFRGAGTPDMRDLIDQGVQEFDLQNNLGVSTLDYVDGVGNPVTYDIDGTPGLRATLEPNIANYIGQVVGFFVHDLETANGANAIYRNVGIRFATVVSVNLNGPSQEFIVQPVPYNGAGVSVDPDAPSSNGQIGRLRLVQ